jgi:putative copper export protein
MSWGDAVVHWLHLMAAIVWVGGTLFTSIVVQPVLRATLPEDRRMAFYAEIGRRLSVVQWTTWSILLLTGLYKLWGVRETPEVFYGPFGRILAVKLSFVAIMVALSLVHSLSWGPAMTRGGLTPAARGALARRAAFWGRINAFVMLAIVFCAVLLRYNPW